MGWIRAALSAIGGVSKAVAAWFRHDERKANERAGANREKLKQQEDAQDARDAFGDIEPPTRDDLIRRLRGNGDI